MTNDGIELYSENAPYRTGALKVSAVHELYFEESGSPQGKPVVFLHGGPGGGTKGKYRRFFNPDKYRIILFDQRGCGRSSPHGSLVENTTWHLVEDMEKLRKHLKISAWQLFGGSWGSTLSLAYAQTYPERVTEMVLRGIFLLRRKEISWFYQEGANTVFPDYWEAFARPIPEDERTDFLQAYYRRLTSSDKSVQMEAARAWSTWEMMTNTLLLNQTNMNRAKDDSFALAFAKIECHYFLNGGFFEPEDLLLKGVEKIRKVPAVIVQGRYDMVCPMTTAWELHKAWPEAAFHVVPGSGHAAFEKGILRELVLATDRFAREG